METIEELIEIFKSTPEMAIWGLLIWCLYILAKLASVVFAIKIVAQLFIKSWHEQRMKKLNNEFSQIKNELDKEKNRLESQELALRQNQFNLEKKHEGVVRISKLFDQYTVSSVEKDYLRDLLLAVKGEEIYIHQSTIKKAIKKLKS